MSYTVYDPIQTSLDPDLFAPLAGGTVYFGVPNGNPQAVVGDRVQVYLARQGLADLAISQPVSIGPGGHWYYNGNPAQIKILVPYCVQAFNSLGVQEYYAPSAGDEVTKFNQIDADLNRSIKTVNTFADFGTTSATIGQQVSLKGYSSQGDGGGGIFDVVSSAGLSNDGGTVAINGSIAFVRRYESVLNALYFGANVLGIVSTSSAMQAAIDALPSTGGWLYCPPGIYLVTTPIKTRNGVIITGEAYSTQFLATTDIEVFTSDSSNINSTIFEAEFRDILIRSTVTGLKTKYDIHLYTPNICKFERVHIQSGHTDGNYANSDVNVGGIFLDRPDGSTTTAFMNRIIDCWIERNSIYMKNISDSSVDGGFCWSYVRPFAIKIEGGGNIRITNMLGIIASQHEGGIVIEGAGVNQIQITGNEYDGNPTLINGNYIVAKTAVIGCLVEGNMFWGSQKNCIWLKDCTGWSITGNTFYKGNAKDNYYDDIRLESVTTSVSGITVSGNTHIIDDVTVNKGYAINEVNSGGGFPSNNSYIGNTISGGGYLPNPFKILGNSHVQGNGGGSYVIPDRLASGQMLLGNSSSGFDSFSGSVATANELISAAGTMDLAVNTTTYSGNPGGFCGFLHVTATRYNFPTQSRREVFSVVCRGTTATITSIVGQDGSGGTSAFTVTVPSNGVLRFTDTSASGSQIAANMTFVGAKSMA